MTTTFSRRRLVGAGAALAALQALPVRFAYAQNYPSRTIRIVVPWPPGGLPDTGGRVGGETRRSPSIRPKASSRPRG